MQPFQYDLRCSAAKDNSIMHAAAAPSNLDAATTMRSAETELGNTIELRTQEQPLFAKHIGGTIRDRNDPSRTRRTDEVPFIVACSHFTRKTQGFVLRLPPQNIAHATFMQPLQCDQQPQLQETHRTTHTGTTTLCKTHRRNNSRQKRPQPHPSHRRATFHRRLQPLYTEKHKVSCSSFLPKT